MDSALLITRNRAYIAKSRKSLFIPLLDLIEGTRLLYGLLLPALLRRQPEVVTVPAAVAQLLSSLALHLPAWGKGNTVTWTRTCPIKPTANSWARRKKEDAVMEIEALLLQQPKESKSHYQQRQAKRFSHTAFKW